MTMSGSWKSSGTGRLATWLPLCLVMLAMPVLDGCSKARVARRGTTVTQVAAPAPTTTTMISSAGVTSEADPAYFNALAPAGQTSTDEEGEEANAFAAITPGSVGGHAGSAAAPGHATTLGLSGDAMPGMQSAAVGSGTAKAVLERIVAAGDMRVFFSTNAIDRGLTGRKVAAASAGDRALVVDAICRQAGLSCFYAADFKSLSVYDPGEFAASGPDMTALVYNRKAGFAEAGTRAPVTSSRPATSVSAPVHGATRAITPTKPSKAKPAASLPMPSRKPAKPASTGASRKPAAPAVKPKPVAATKKPPVPSLKPKA
ncbi:MAG: hypothetical protein PHS60_01395 [Zavarzinia sp.]|nr:hypothetical protein [Zavarzinia sp.]